LVVSTGGYFYEYLIINALISVEINKFMIFIMDKKGQRRSNAKQYTYIKPTWAVRPG
jgi:hypothetical protein